MSAFGPGDGKAPEHKGKIHTASSKPKKIGQAKGKGYLKMRMKQDDSVAVNMSDRKYGGGIGQTGSAK